MLLADSPPPTREAPAEPLRILYLGNSLTAANDLPALVAAMAASAGVRIEWRAVTPGGVNLEDHWHDGRGEKLLSAERWDFLVLQQGPSSRMEGRADLRLWAARWAQRARRREVEPALYMVWPYQGQKRGFEDVATSYREAAKAAKSRILPAGEAWEACLDEDPETRLYEEDKLHPTLAGSWLAALVLTKELAGVEPESVPDRLELDSGRRVELDPALARRLSRAAAGRANEGTTAEPTHPTPASPPPSPI